MISRKSPRRRTTKRHKKTKIIKRYYNINLLKENHLKNHKPTQINYIKYLLNNVISFYYIAYLKIHCFDFGFLLEYWLRFLEEGGGGFYCCFIL